MKMNKNSHDCEQFNLHELKSSKLVKKLLLVFIFVLGLICSVGKNVNADTENKVTNPEVKSQKENLKVNGYDYKYIYTKYNSNTDTYSDIYRLDSAKTVQDRPKTIEVFVHSHEENSDTKNKGTEPEWNQEVFYQIKSEKENYPFYKLRYKPEVKSQKENLQVNGYDYKYTYTTYSSITGTYRDIYCLVSAKEVQDSPKTIEVFVNSRGEELGEQPTHTLPTKPEDVVASQA